MKFELYQDASGGWRWRARATNGQLTASSGEAFASKSNAKRSIEAFKKAAGDAEIVETDADA
ncbi:MAG: DUF1508 domain-containing protein [Candidatus Limnocylindrales bacterium]